MAEFKAFDPKTEVIGQGILVMLEGVGVFQPTAVKILAERGIKNVQAEAWYPMQAYLDAYRQIAEKVGSATLKQIGRKVPEIAIWPPQINSVETALASIDAAYQMNQRGGKNGAYTFTKTGERTGKMVCHNPFPCLFDSGLVEAVAQKFAPTNARVKVTHDETRECRQHGGETCTLLISW
jgi:hypothetical protein